MLSTGGGGNEDGMLKVGKYGQLKVWCERRVDEDILQLNRQHSGKAGTHTQPETVSIGDIPAVYGQIDPLEQRPILDL